MGGREAIYCGIMRPDVFGYVGGACPAPGITPGTDSFMTHPGCMQESEFKFRNVGPEPEVFMITGGTNDSVVGTFPSQYSSILTKNGVNHVYQSIPGGGHGAESVKPHLYTFFRYAFKANEGGSTGGGNVVTTITTTTTKPVTTTTTTIQPNNGGNGGFDMGNFGGQGGFDMGQFGGNGGNSKADIDAKVSKWGDANGDGTIDMGDAVAILQALANPNKYKLSEQGTANADVYEAGSGLTANDANSIQMYLLGLIKSLPESYSSNVSSSSATTTTTAKATTTTTTTVAVNNGGFDMSQFGGQGGNGGFDMGNFDWSQMGGQGGNGGFDMSQFGGQGGNGGFDMSQFGGQGGNGGFDMSQFGGQGGNGGFDMSQFGGQGGNGGFDMSQFGGQGGFDMGGNNGGQQTGGNGGAQVQSGKKLCAISFDDGASAQSKSDPGYRIIDALIKNNMTATFFIVGDWIKTNDQIKYEYQNGMEVANHTQSHPHLGQLGSSQIRSEWENCNSKLKGIIGAEPSHLMRLPYLESNATVQSALNDVPLISCAIDTQDWNNASKDQIVNTIKQAAQNGSLEGAIVLCHENYATTAAAMEEVLPWLAQNGYQNVNISDMAKAHGKTLAGGQVHTRA
ncbi:MAG: polysaccharide deacetylase family protein [Ruminococcus sp.]|nr:polysaccharide deacetylase family protein [Ruminococcus sp.]